MAAGQSFSDRFVKVLDCYYTPIRRWQGRRKPAAPSEKTADGPSADSATADQTSLSRWSA